MYRCCDDQRTERNRVSAGALYEVAAASDPFFIQSTSGKRDSSARDKPPKIAFRPETVSAETETQPQKPANRGLASWPSPGNLAVRRNAWRAGSRPRRGNRAGRAMALKGATYVQPALEGTWLMPNNLLKLRQLFLVSRFRSSHHYAARSLANFGIKGTLAIYDSSAVFGFEVPTRTRGYNDRNFKSTALDRA